MKKIGQGLGVIFVLIILWNYIPYDVSAYLTINPKMYGAKGDGRTDDTKAIQQAFNVAKENGGARIQFPPGLYVINGVISIYDNTHVIFEKNAAIKRGGHRSLIFINGEYGTEKDGYSNITFEGGTIYGNPNGSPSNMWYGVFGLHHGRNLVFKNMIFIDAMSDGHIFDLAGCDGVLIENCQFLGRVNKMISRNYSEAIQLDLSTNVGFPAFGKYDGKITSNVTVRNCTFQRNKENPKSIAPNPIGQHSHFNRLSKNIVFENNYCEEWNFAAIRLMNVDGLYVKNNQFIAKKNTLANGVRIEIPSDAYDASNPYNVKKLPSGTYFPSKNIFIEGNTFKNFLVTSDKVAIVAVTGRPTANITNIVIKGNQFLNNATHSGAVYPNPIHMNDLNKVEIRLNTFDLAYRAVSIRDSKEVILAQNMVKNMQWDSFTVQRVSILKILQNTIHGTVWNGLQIGRSSNVEIIGNTLTEIATQKDRVGMAIGSCKDVLIKDNVVRNIKNPPLKIGIISFSLTKDAPPIRNVFGKNTIIGAKISTYQEKKK